MSSHPPTNLDRTLTKFVESEHSKQPQDHAVEPSPAVVSPLVSVEDGKRDCGIDGPLTTADEDKVFTYIEKKVSSNPDDLLWHLVLIAAKSKGRLRSEDGALDASGPDSAIVELLLGDDNASPNVTASVGELNASKGKGKCCRVDTLNKRLSMPPLSP